MPKSVQPLLDLLLAAGVVEEPDATQALWSICPPGVKTPMPAVKLRSADMLLAGVDPKPKALDVKLARDHSEGPAPAGQSQRPQPPAQSTPVPAAPSAPSPAVANAAVPATATPIQAQLALSTESPMPEFSLRAPMRLNPRVREVLTDIVQTLNPGQGPAQGSRVEQGFFVPLSEFERRAMPPATALRALAELDMLVLQEADGPPTQSLEFNGAQTVGLVLAPSFVTGIDACAVPVEQRLPSC